jgi:hypothetical protein
LAARYRSQENMRYAQRSVEHDLVAMVTPLYVVAILQSFASLDDINLERFLRRGVAASRHFNAELQVWSQTEGSCVFR